MSELDNLLKAALQAQIDGEASLSAARHQHQALVGLRAETAAKLQAAEETKKAARGALTKGGGEKAYSAAMSQVQTLKACLLAFDDTDIPEALEACDAAAKAFPSVGYVAALKLRSRAQSDLTPLYERYAELMATEATLLSEIEAAHSSLLEEHRCAYQTLFDPRVPLGDLLKAVPPAVRKLHGPLFTGYDLGPALESRFLPFSDDAFSDFLARVDRVPSDGELAKFNPAAAPPLPPYVSEPRPEPGPARMHGVVLSTPGAVG